VTISPQGKITDVNVATEQATGLSRQALIGSDFSSYFTEPQKANDGYQAVIRDGFVRDYPLTMRHVSGRTMDVLYNANLYRNELGEVQGVFAAARDITDRKRMEEELRAASLYARSLIEASLDPLVTISPQGKITDVNRATELATGATRQQLIGSDFSSYFTDPQQADRGYRRVLADGLVRDYPLTIRHASGQTMDVLYNAAVYRNDAGELQGVFAAARDITEAKATERRQAVTNALLELFARKATRKEYVDSVVEVIQRWSGCQCVGVRVVNNRGTAPYESCVGFSEDFLVREKIRCADRNDCLCIRIALGTPEPQDARWLTPAGSFRLDNAVSLIGATSDNREPGTPVTCVQAGLSSIAVIAIRYRGETFGAVHLADERPDMIPAASVQFLESMAPLIGEALHRFNAEAELVSYRERLEELVRQRTDELQRSEGLLRSITDTTEDAIYAKDCQSRMVFVNPASLRLVGKSAEQVLGHTDAEFYDDPAIGAAILENDRLLLASGVAQVFEEIVDTPHGRRVMLSSKVPWRDSDDQVIGVIGVSRDITNRTRAEQELRDSERRVRASLAEKEVLLKEIHHRVKNNMQVISSLVALQSERAPEGIMRDVLTDVMHRVRSMALVHEKLYQSTDLARIEFGEYARSLLSYLWRAHADTATGVRLALDLEPVPLSVNVAVPCGLILNELVSNALKHAFRGRDCGQIAVSLRRDADGGVRLRVRDDGVGLPAAMQWEQADSLGLHLVRMLAGQLRATVNVQSDGGTAFTIRFNEGKP